MHQFHQTITHSAKNKYDTNANAQTIHAEIPFGPNQFNQEIHKKAQGRKCLLLLQRMQRRLRKSRKIHAVHSLQNCQVLRRHLPKSGLAQAQKRVQIVEKR
jgi:hypothetical protein